MQYITLRNGVKMPALGYGVYQVDPAECERCVADALAVGYRSVDTAQAYHNEEGVGNAVAKSGVPREELFLTTKVWISNAGYERAKASIDASLKKLRTDYIDLYRQYPFDLVLSGHTHGGQVRIPLLVNGLFAPDQGWFPQYAGGLYEVGETSLVVSRGLSYYPRLPRVFDPPEVVVIDVEGTRKAAQS